MNKFIVIALIGLMSSASFGYYGGGGYRRGGGGIDTGDALVLGSLAGLLAASSTAQANCYGCNYMQSEAEVISTAITEMRMGAQMSPELMTKLNEAKAITNRGDEETLLMLEKAADMVKQQRQQK
jgi:hypothetical protein